MKGQNQEIQGQNRHNQRAKSRTSMGTIEKMKVQNRKDKKPKSKHSKGKPKTIKDEIKRIKRQNKRRKSRKPKGKIQQSKGKIKNINGGNQTTNALNQRKEYEKFCDSKKKSKTRATGFRYIGKKKQARL